MKNKIFSLILILTIFLGFGMTVNAEIEQDNITIVVDISNMDDRIELYNLIESYNIEVEDSLYIHSITVYGQYPGPPLITESDIALNGEPFIHNNGVWGYTISGGYDYIEDIEENVTNWQIFDIDGFTPLYYVITLPPPPIEESPFTGLVDFFKNFLEGLLKSITDTTMYLINNIWDTNLIDINFVILSDTAIYTGTLNDLLYSVFSIFYVIFAITVVWRLLKKLLRKLFSIVRW